jgi:hypothetical protein
MTILKEESLYKTDVFTPKSQFLEVGFFDFTFANLDRKNLIVKLYIHYSTNFY